MLMIFFYISILSYQIAAFDLIINNICMGLTFKSYNKQYNILCKICIKIQSKCCGINQRNKNEMHPEFEFVRQIRNNNPKIVSNNSSSTTKIYTPSASNNKALNDNITTNNERIFVYSDDIKIINEK